MASSRIGDPSRFGDRGGSLGRSGSGILFIGDSPLFGRYDETLTGGTFLDEDGPEGLLPSKGFDHLLEILLDCAGVSGNSPSSSSPLYRRR